MNHDDYGPYCVVSHAGLAIWQERLRELADADRKATVEYLEKQAQKAQPQCSVQTFDGMVGFGGTFAEAFSDLVRYGKGAGR